MATPTWSQLTFLTAGQQARGAQFAAIGAALQPRRPPPDISGVTYSQAKAARQMLKELNDLVGPAIRGIQYVIDQGQKQAVTDFDSANP